MIKEALQYIIGIGNTRIESVGNQTYSTQPIHLVRDPLPAALKVRSLTGIVDYLKSDFDMLESVLVHVVSPTEVAVVSVTNFDENRATHIEAIAQLPEFKFGAWYDTEEFIIALQAKFLPEYSRDAILKLVGNIKEEAVRQVGDNGISQAVTAKTGIASLDTVVVPNPVVLAPFRTFVEVDQPASEFVFRLQNGPRAALFEADGGAWKNEAMQRVATYLRAELADLIEGGKVVIIA